MKNATSFTDQYIANSRYANFFFTKACNKTKQAATNDKSATKLSMVAQAEVHERDEIIFLPGAPPIDEMFTDKY